MARPTPPPARPDRVPAAVTAALFAATFLLFAPAVGHPLTVLDDPTYIEEHPHVRGGLTAGNAGWAFTTGYFCNWHPLTWLSYQLDATLFGGDAVWGYHLTNVFLHAVNAAVLFRLLLALTGCPWRSAAAAGLWALHPQRVESVVWVSERKDVLSTLFWLLATAAYVRYARRPSAGRYAATAALLAAGLMCKPMLVTLPCVLLLLDYWPLGRVGVVPARRLVAEKLPLFAVAAGMCVVTLRVQSGAMQGAAEYGLETRAANAVLGYAAYLRQAVWPAGLAPFYPHTYPKLTDPAVLGCAAGLAATTAAFAGLGRRFPYLPVGWFWYLGTLVPVIGLVQVGAQARADRYTYVPMIGLTVAAVWAVAAAFDALRVGRPVRAAAGGLVVTALVAATAAQVGRWANDAALWEHTLAVTTPDNAPAHAHAGMAYNRLDRPDLALPHFEAAARGNPADGSVRFLHAQALYRAGRYEDAAAGMEIAYRADPSPGVRRNLGILLARVGRAEEGFDHLLATAAGDEPAARRTAGAQALDGGFPAAAADQFGREVALAPDDPDARFRLGSAWLAGGEYDRAAAAFREAVRLRPGHAPALTRLGLLALRANDTGEAERLLRAAVVADPGSADAAAALGLVLARAGRPAEAAAAFASADRLDPKWAGAATAAAWEAGTKGKPGVSVLLPAYRAEAACAAGGYRNPGDVMALAAAVAADGRFAEAAALVDKVRPLADPQTARTLDEQAAAYRAGRSLRP